MLPGEVVECYEVVLALDAVAFFTEVANFVFSKTKNDMDATCGIGGG